MKNNTRGRYRMYMRALAAALVFSLCMTYVPAPAFGLDQAAQSQLSGADFTVAYAADARGERWEAMDITVEEPGVYRLEVDHGAKLNGGVAGVFVSPKTGGSDQRVGTVDFQNYVYDRQTGTYADSVTDAEKTTRVGMVEFPQAGDYTVKFQAESAGHAGGYELYPQTLRFDGRAVDTLRYDFSLGFGKRMYGSKSAVVGMSYEDTGNVWAFADYEETLIPFNSSEGAYYPHENYISASAAYGIKRLITGAPINGSGLRFKCRRLGGTRWS